MARGYATATLMFCGALPCMAIAYLYWLQSQGQTPSFENHGFHQFAIAFAILECGLVTYLTWRCYKVSGEPLLRWLTLGFLAFTIIYTPHGIFTAYSHHNMWLFLLYGPASRLVMTACLFKGLLVYGKPAHDLATRENRASWGKWIVVFLLINVAVAACAVLRSNLRMVARTMEMIALGLSLAGVAVIFLQSTRSHLLRNSYSIALAAFAQSSLAFLLTRPWSHLWWLAHLIFAAGFTILGYGVVRALLTTGSLSTVYSEEESYQQLLTDKGQMAQGLADLQSAQTELEKLAATDPLTGAANRRQFFIRFDIEGARARRTGAPFSVLALDLDRFKNINDQYGHQAGDEVLKFVVTSALPVLRPSDVLGRIGGEEFAILLPETSLQGAQVVAERLRQGFALGLIVHDQFIATSLSIGVAQSGLDGDEPAVLLGTADKRLYCAKQAGRNRVVSESAEPLDVIPSFSS